MAWLGLAQGSVSGAAVPRRVGWLTHQMPIPKFHPGTQHAGLMPPHSLCLASWPRVSRDCAPALEFKATVCMVFPPGRRLSDQLQSLVSALRVYK